MTTTTAVAAGARAAVAVAVAMLWSFMFYEMVSTKRHCNNYSEVAMVGCELASPLRILSSPLHIIIIITASHPIFVALLYLWLVRYPLEHLQFQLFSIRFHYREVAPPIAASGLATGIDDSSTLLLLIFPLLTIERAHRRDDMSVEKGNTCGFEAVSGIRKL